MSGICLSTEFLLYSYTSSEITTLGPPVIPRNLTLGEPCGSCLCPPNYTLGDCEQGLRCEHDTLTADAPGLCVKLGNDIFSDKIQVIFIDKYF